MKSGQGDVLIHLFGDSITAGVPGVAFCKYFTVLQDYKNHGVGGDTVTGLLNRIADFQFNEQDTYIMEIGTNDILLSCLKERSTSWRRTIDKIEQSGRSIARDKEEFYYKYKSLIERIGYRKVIFVSIPCIGEDIDSKINEIVDLYNKMIEQLCTDKGLQYVDFNTWQREEISAYKHEHKAFIGNHPIRMIMDVLLTKFINSTNILSYLRNLRTTIDGVHLNSNGASMLAKMIESAVKKNNALHVINSNRGF